MDNQTFLTLVARALSGEAGDEDLKELETYFRENDAYKRKFHLLKEYWENKSGISTDTNKALQKVLLQIKDEKKESTPSIEPPNQKTPRLKLFFRFSKVAVLISFCLGAAYYILSKNNHSSIVKHQPDASEWQIKATPKGSKSTLLLADGTKVILNSASSLKFPLKFSGNTREVYLTGEAFFDVTHNASFPFIIHTDKMNIKVLGTEFNVKSYPGDSTSETTLIRGLIQVTLNDRPSDKIILRPKEKLVVTREPTENDISSAKTAPHAREVRLLISNLHYISPKDSSIVETSWLENKLVFQDESFDKLSMDMERWYGINIHFSNPQIKEYRFTGIFEKESIYQALNALKLTEKFNYKIEGDTITIY